MINEIVQWLCIVVLFVLSRGLSISYNELVKQNRELLLENNRLMKRVSIQEGQGHAREKHLP